ncbi:uncharacterized protein LOC134196191 isoform X4 [Corticium candelabrum]|uniref:uncharacterized protein LOC134196191 isoform X4 n=1 Tax=Corticium candelabrum TaxID=121492 RepID=UPI002E2599E3|nr:uncharacterized protein LOC134196191 isoform X4 [Corticium candelabrum]
MSDVKRKSLDKSGCAESCRSIMVICCVPGCTNVSAKGKYLKFFRFSSNEEQRQKWHFPRGTKSTAGVIQTLSKTNPPFFCCCNKAIQS